MSIVEELADKLAKDAIEAADTLDDDQLVNRIAEVIGASSPSTEEAYRTAVRVRMAEARARRYLEEQLSKGKAAPDRTG
ncbi:hypothetical protein E2K80_06335 [Rhodophyticola sp. CCM32]|uniref:hypothetical protein n=1 Tax=Rhodophyticola sp. CCM32 TaxID=2916397 RepID=UPI00107FC065|nr:hypothetical protein [Rhodophyticola sp. CCM32]QBY00404.1 hypothetical protein E2K80_06335 [Rhodophyticola sp. CCM32]